MAHAAEVEGNKLQVNDLFTCKRLAKLRDGRLPSKYEAANDEDASRATAIFKVLATRWAGGSSDDGWGMGHSSGYPDGWEVTAQRTDSGEEIVKFYQSGCFCAVLEPSEIVNVPTCAAVLDAPRCTTSLAELRKQVVK